MGKGTCVCSAITFMEKNDERKKKASILVYFLKSLLLKVNKKIIFFLTSVLLTFTNLGYIVSCIVGVTFVIVAFSSSGALCTIGTAC